MQGALTNEPNAVEIEVTFRNFGITPQAKEYALKRLDKVVRSLPNLAGAAVEIRFDRNAPEESAVVVQATLSAKGTLLRAEDSGINATAAIDRVHDILSRRIRDWKGRKHASRRRDAARRRDALEVEAAAADDGVTESEIEPGDADNIVRMKIHETKPLFVEDAVEEMNLVGHDFYFFLNAETERHCVVYRRKAGGYGLIQPNVEKMEGSHGEGA
jgi:putative sigma-54 modulation protein